VPQSAAPRPTSHGPYDTEFVRRFSMPKRVVPVRRCVNVRLPLEANTASADFELVNDWVNLDESDGQTHQRSLIRRVRVGHAKKANSRANESVPARPARILAASRGVAES